MAGTRKLGRATDHRNAMLRGLVTFFLDKGRIETTVTRAKEVRILAEKLITLAKEENLHNKRLAMSFITQEDVVYKLFKEIAPKYKDVNGGTQESQSSALVEATQLRWLLSSCSNLYYL